MKAALTVIHGICVIGCSIMIGLHLGLKNPEFVLFNLASGLLNLYFFMKGVSLDD